MLSDGCTLDFNSSNKKAQVSMVYRARQRTANAIQRNHSHKEKVQKEGKQKKKDRRKEAGEEKRRKETEKEIKRKKDRQKEKFYYKVLGKIFLSLSINNDKLLIYILLYDIF